MRSAPAAAEIATWVVLGQLVGQKATALRHEGADRRASWPTVRGQQAELGKLLICQDQALPRLGIIGRMAGAVSEDLLQRRRVGGDRVIGRGYDRRKRALRFDHDAAPD